MRQGRSRTKKYRALGSRRYEISMSFRRCPRVCDGPPLLQGRSGQGLGGALPEKPLVMHREKALVPEPVLERGHLHAHATDGAMEQHVPRTLHADAVHEACGRCTDEFLEEGIEAALTHAGRTAQVRYGRCFRQVIA